MKTKVIFTATIEVDVPEIWQDSSPLSQITKDAERSARYTLGQMPLFNDLHMSEIRCARVILSPEEGV